MHKPLSSAVSQLACCMMHPLKSGTTNVCSHYPTNKINVAATGLGLLYIVAIWPAVTLHDYVYIMCVSSQISVQSC